MLVRCDPLMAPQTYGKLFSSESDESETSVGTLSAAFLPSSRWRCIFPSFRFISILDSKDPDPELALASD